MKELLAEAKTMQKELVTWRRQIHQNAETGMDLPLTSAFVFEKLEQMGYAPARVAETGIVALAGGKKPGKCILLRADMDALPITEESGEEFSSTNGKMHACGHDMHTTMLLGAARLLKAREDEIEGTIKLMFQPAEETLKGAKAMVEAGVLENPKVDAAAMFHVAAGMPFPSGLLIVPPAGPFASTSDWFEITISGKGGHGAMPQSTVDPLNVMSHLHIALQAINSREVAPGDVAIVTVGEMHGGETSNVIPDTAVMKGTIRTYDEENRQFVFQRIKDISNGIAAAFRATADAQIIIGCPAVHVDGQVSGDIREALTEVFGPAVPDVSLFGKMKMGGSEDFSYVTEKVPSVMMSISAGGTMEGYEHTMHHPKVRFNEDILWQGAAAYAVAGMGWLAKNG